MHILSGARLVFLLFFLTALVACGGGGGAAEPLGGGARQSAYEYRIPTDQGDGWAVGHLDDQDIDSSSIVEMMRMATDGTYPGIDGISIARNGTLLLDALLRRELDEFDGWVNNVNLSRHIMHSTSKSFTSALIGIAIDQGYIADTDVPFYDFFAYGSYDNWDPRKATMTLEDALTMRLGFRWDEWSHPYGHPENDLTILTSQNNNYAKALLDLPIVTDPGTTFVYNTAATTTIGQALENAVGVPMEQFAEMYLFAPLQVRDAVWGKTPNGLPNGGSGLFLRPRDMAKFGQLFLDGGVWQGQRIISAEWVARSVERHVSLSWNDTSGYGYQWWLDDFVVNGRSVPSYSTRGFGGQYIFVVPSLNLVVAFTGRNYGTAAAGNPFDMMAFHIIPAMH